MANSYKRTLAGPICGCKAGEGRYFKRLKAKIERASAKRALALGQDADFAFTPSVTYDIGDGKVFYRFCSATEQAKLLRK